MINLMKSFKSMVPTYTPSLLKLRDSRTKISGLGSGHVILNLSTELS